jgi:hypothetical protein
VASEAVDLDVVRQIREEGLERSHIEELARYLTEVNGPRLTGSPGMKRAHEWTAKTFEEWGLENIVIEPWGEFGRGWSHEDYKGRILTPWVQPLHGQPMAWTGSTDGTVRGTAVIVKAETVEDLEDYRGKLDGTFVLMEDMQDGGHAGSGAGVRAPGPAFVAGGSAGAATGPDDRPGPGQRRPGSHVCADARSA